MSELTFSVLGSTNWYCPAHKYFSKLLRNLVINCGGSVDSPSFLGIGISGGYL